MTFSLFDHPHFKALLGRDDLGDVFTADAEIEAMLRFERALALAEAEAGVIPEASANAISEAIEYYKPDRDVLKAGVARDGLIVPALVASLRASLNAAHRDHLHFGATSQDAIDTGLMLRLKIVLSLFRDDLQSVVERLARLAEGRESERLMGRTRMQRALPIHLADRIAIWKDPLSHHLSTLDQQKDHLLVVQLGGPVGTLDTLGAKGNQVRTRLAEHLELGDPGHSWHTERDRIVDLAGWLSKVSGSLGKIGQDVALMAQNEVGEVVIGEGGHSSAMPHKRNPVQAELLVTLARYNAVEIGSLHQALVHEGERSGSAWTLEWLTLPSMIAATGSALSIAAAMLDTIELTLD